MLSHQQRAEVQTAVQLHLARAFGPAETIYQRIAAEAPDDFQINHLLGILLQQTDRPRQAVARLEKARAFRPLSAPTVMWLGLAQRSLGCSAEADQALRLAVALGPKAPEAWANLGSHQVVMGRIDQAIASFTQALKLNPVYAAGWTGLGSALQAAGRGEEAIVCHTRALEIDPHQSRARFARAQAWQTCYSIEDSLADFDAHLALRPEHHEARSFRLFLLNYRDDLSAQAIFAEHRAYGRAVEETTSRRPAAIPARRAIEAGGRLRLGFLSPDFRSHSVAFFIEPLLAHLDRSQFEVILYHDHYSIDAVSERLRSQVDRWRPIAGWSASAVEEAIRSDAPDVLIDLAGHTGFNRLDLFARRLAPMQLSYLGYPNTTGLSAMDYRFTDAVADPRGESDDLHTERLVRFSSTAWTYAPAENAPDPRRELSPGEDRVVFGSFNALSKLSPSTLKLWREVLEAIPESHLVLKSANQAPKPWRERLVKVGIPAHRVTLAPPSPDHQGHLSAYAKIDIALDPFPYNGTTTTCEALWMGVPVITLAGDRHVARVGSSLLTAVDHPEWIAQSPEDYVRIAADLAANRSLRAELRTGLRTQMRRSVLLDHAGQAARFGAAVWDGFNRCLNGSETGEGKNFRSSVEKTDPDMVLSN